MSNGSKLIDVADLIMGQSPPSETYNEEGIGLPFYQGKSDFGATYPTPRIFCSAPLRIAEPGDILMSVRAPVGATNLCKERSCIGRGLTAIRPHGVDRDFLYFNLKHIEPYLDSLGSGAIFKAINKHQLSQATVNEVGFDSPEQQRIAQVLSTVQEAIAQQERLIHTTTELKQALMQKLFTEGLRGEALKETEIGRVPESWEVVKLRQLIDVIHGYAFGGEHFTNQGPIVLTPGNFKLDGGLYWGERTKYTTEECPPQYLLKPRDLVMVMTDLTPSAKLLGGPAFIPEGKVILHNQRIGKVDLLGTETSTDFLYRVFLTDRFKQYMLQTATGSTVRHTSPTRITDYVVALPSKKEQSEMCEALNRVDDRLASLERKRESLQDLFRTLLHELMTGKVRVAAK